MLVTHPYISGQGFNPKECLVMILFGLLFLQLPFIYLRAEKRRLDNLSTRCKTDKKDNYYTTGAKYLKIATLVALISLLFVMVGLIYLYCMQPDASVLFLLIIMILFLFGVQVLVIKAYREKLFPKFTLFFRDLNVHTKTYDATIPYKEVKQWLTEYPPFVCDCFYVIVLRNRIIRFYCSTMIGPTDFLTILFRRSGAAAPDFFQMTLRCMGYTYRKRKSEYKILAEFEQSLADHPNTTIPIMITNETNHKKHKDQTDKQNNKA